MRRGIPRRILVVCYGNICRSPYAEAYLRAALAKASLTGVEVRSAGFFGPGRPANRQGMALARRRGIDLEGHCSQLVQARSASGMPTLVLVMTRSQRNQLLSEFAIPGDHIELLSDFDATDPISREISDPYGKSDEEFVRVFDEIERSVQGLVDVWSGYGIRQASESGSLVS